MDLGRSSSGDVQVVASKKDFIRVEWQVLQPRSDDVTSSAMMTSSILRGYRVRYQAIGSSYVHESSVLSPTVGRFDIESLHENTLYNICVRAVYNTAGEEEQIGCVHGTTQTDSLMVAVGSTLGAFVTLAFIVLLVFLAKRQHHRRRDHFADMKSPEAASLHDLPDDTGVDERRYDVAEWRENCHSPHPVATAPRRDTVIETSGGPGRSINPNTDEFFEGEDAMKGSKRITDDDFLDCRNTLDCNSHVPNCYNNGAHGSSTSSGHEQREMLLDRHLLQEEADRVNRIASDSNDVDGVGYRQQQLSRVRSSPVAFVCAGEVLDKHDPIDQDAKPTQFYIPTEIEDRPQKTNTELAPGETSFQSVPAETWAYCTPTTPTNAADISNKRKTLKLLRQQNDFDDFALDDIHA